MEKLGSIDLSADRLISIAADAIEDHNYIKALKMLNKNAVLNGNDEDSFMLYAEAFDDMGLYEKCVNGWFRYIDYAEEFADLAEAYEGLAISYMNLGQESFAAYYYNKLLMETNVELTDENRRDIINSFLSTEKKPLKFAYPPELADYSEEIESGIAYMRSNDYDSAIGEFSKVNEGNEKYLSARNYIAMCEIISDRCEQAEEECRAILRRNPADVQALTTLAAVKSQQKKSGEAREIALQLLSLNAQAPDDIYKIATVCCENKMHDKAYELFKKLKSELAYDFSILFFTAISAYNCGKIDDSLQAFDTLLTIYPNAVTAEYWKFIVSKNAKMPAENREELEYFYRLPREEGQTNIEFLTAFARLTDRMSKKLSEEADIDGSVRWCFDEGDGNHPYELHLLGSACAVKAGFNDTVRDILLDAFLPDGIKMETVSELVQRNEGGNYGIVICNLYRRLTLLPLDIGRNKRKIFLRAYGMAFSRFAMLSDDYGALLNDAATYLYFKLDSENRLGDVRSVPVLAAAIVKSSKIKESGLSEEYMLSFFGANKDKVDALLGE